MISTKATSGGSMVVVGPGQTLEALLVPWDSSLGWESSLFLLDSCNTTGDGCVAGSSDGSNADRITFTNDGETDLVHFLVVDFLYTAASFDLIVDIY